MDVKLFQLNLLPFLKKRHVLMHVLGSRRILACASQNKMMGHMQPRMNQLECPDIENCSSNPC